MNWKGAVRVADEVFGPMEALSLTCKICAHSFRVGTMERTLHCPRCQTRYDVVAGQPRRASLATGLNCPKCHSPVEVVLYVNGPKGSETAAPTWGPETVASIICNGTLDTHSMLHTLKASWTNNTLVLTPGR